MKLDEIRKEIDEVDREFIQLLARRVEAARRVGEFKKHNPDACFRDTERELALFGQWTRAARDLDLSEYFAGRILREILNHSRRIQEEHLDPSAENLTLRIGYQGEPGAYSDLAIGKLFSSRDDTAVRRIGFHTFTEVIDALESGTLDRALLPIENTIAGSLNEVYRLLATRQLQIVDEEILPVEHCLAVLPGTREDDIRVIRSHPVALQQCQRFLDQKQQCRAETYYDTAAAALSVAREQQPGLAAIASEEAARRHGLTIVRRNIADQSTNFTRFLLISREAQTVDLRRPAKTSLVFTVNHRRGALARCLDAFAREEINLTKLESRNVPDTPWEYLFYVDIEANAADPKTQAVFGEIGNYTNYFKLLGCYPRRSDDLASVPTDTSWSLRSGEVSTEEESSVAPLEPKDLSAAPARNGKLRLVSITPGQPRSLVSIGNVSFGGDRFVLISGPCAVESRQQILDTAAIVKACGGSVLRGGAFKPRSSPYSFQGLGFPGIDLLVEAGRAYEMPVVTEVLQAEDVDRVARHADALQVGARNMQNYSLLKKLGTVNRTILLKRGMSATIEDLLLAAEHIVAGGNHRVILCERGIRTFETATRSTLDVSAVPVLKSRTHLPVIVDPSHAAGVRALVIPLALAAVAAGADGLIVEAHADPASALCDADQALSAEDLRTLMRGVEPIVRSQGRRL